MLRTVVNAIGIASLSLAALALSSCGGSSGGGGGTTGTVPTAAPSGAPTTAPTSAPTATAPVPTPTPTTGPATPTPGPPVASGQTIHAEAGSLNGQPGAYTPPEGNTPSGGTGSPIDGINCDPTMSNKYHVHVFLAVYNNGTYVAQPYAVGMVNPQPAVAGFVNEANCFYYLHTHDSSGIIHVEDPNPNNIPTTQSIFTLRNVLDVWGISADSNHFGPFQGPVRVYTSGQVYRGGGNNAIVNASTYMFYGNDPTTIPLYSHEVMFVEVGPNYPAALPNVHFYTAF
ncbi:MAG: hypothetical protein JO322_13580 [Candidatus Eremiobacteraeota bacterium]|nr:hypothetical protein [Candidatus Eremiobacteraeota bacterium]